jgi:hypothetical protein
MDTTTVLDIFKILHLLLDMHGLSYKLGLGPAVGQSVTCNIRSSMALKTVSKSFNTKTFRNDV